MATREVMQGHTILAISFTDQYLGATFRTSQPGVFSGFAFYHGSFDSSSTLEFFDFKDIVCHLDSYAREVLEMAVPGWHERDSPDEPFHWEPLELSGGSGEHEET